MSAKPVYEFISDPGHGWLKVPLADLPKGFHPSQYSFKDSQFAYLEEDCDASAFHALRPGFDVREVYVNNFDRNRKRFAAVQS